jgi:hypothetical protein
MKRTARIAVVVVSALVIAVAAVAWLVSGPAADAPTTSSPPETEMVTLWLHAAGDVSTRVTYTCVDDAGQLGVCETTVKGGVWAEDVTVPAGATVRVQAKSDTMIPPWCSIAEKTDRNVLHQDRDGGVCEWVAKK